MHEVSLTALVPSSRVLQVLHLLSGFTASHPTKLHEEHRLYAPTKGVKESLDAAALKALQAQAAVDVQRSVTLLGAKPIKAGGDLHFLQIVRNLDTLELTPTNWQGTAEHHNDAQRLSSGLGGQTWTIQMHGVPDPGVKTHSLRYASYSEVNETEGNNVNAYLEDIGFEHRSTYTITGHYLVYGNVVFRLHNVNVPSTATNESSQADVGTSPNIPASSILTATVRVSDGTNPTLVQQAKKELDSCKAELRGVVDLKAPDRLSLDTRTR